MISYYLFRLLEWVLMRLGASWRRNFFLFLADAAYLVDSKHRRVILQNLHFALGRELSSETTTAISKYCYRNLMLAVMQIMENYHLTPDKLAEFVTFENRNKVDEALRDNRRIIFVSAHYGNWELGATALSALITPTTSIYKKLNNPYFERYLKASRARLSLEMIEKRGAVKYLTRALKNHHAVSMMIDQNTNRRDGIVINFFGKSARQTAAPAFLARKYDALIIPLFITTKDHITHTIRFADPIEVNQSDNVENDILEATQRQADAVEKVVREHPEYWFWCHRRWKTEHPEIYKTL